jgi:hypothetical protein
MSPYFKSSACTVALSMWEAGGFWDLASHGREREAILGPC